MSEIIIYHNPRCKKSRQALDLIKSKNIKPHIFLYLKNKILKQDLKEILIKLKLKPRDLLRTGENEYKINDISNPCHSDDDIIDFMIKFPKLIQRPIVIFGDKAIVGRPPEKLLEII